MEERTFTVCISSSMSDEQYVAFIREVTEALEQAACDYAATCSDDTYLLEINHAANNA